MLSTDLRNVAYVSQTQLRAAVEQAEQEKLSQIGYKVEMYVQEQLHPILIEARDVDERLKEIERLIKWVVETHPEVVQEYEAISEAREDTL